MRGCSSTHVASCPETDKPRTALLERRVRANRSVDTVLADVSAAGHMADDFYLRYYVGHKGKFGHEFLEFEFNKDGRVRLWGGEAMQGV
jgi:hypothetical protein